MLKTAEPLKKWHIALSLVASFILSIGISVDLGLNREFIYDEFGNKVEELLTARSFFYSFNGNAPLFIVTFALFAIVGLYAFRVRNRRAMITAGICAAIIAFFRLLGLSLNNVYGIDDRNRGFSQFMAEPLQVFKTLLRFIGVALLVYMLLVLLFDYLGRRTIRPGKETVSVFDSHISSFFLVWGFIFVCWLPYWFACFPGILSNDSYSQIEQALSSNYENHHPFAHTLLITLFVKLGGLFGGLKVSVALYAVFQMLCMSAAFSFAVFYMGRRGVHKGFRIGAFLWFALYPNHGLYSVTMWKDVLFAALLLLYTIVVIEMIYKREAFFKKPLYLVAFGVIAFLVMISRNNGFYVVLLSFPFILLAFRAQWLRILCVAASCVLLYTAYKNVLFPLAGVREGTVKEALSIPLQQIARIEKYHREELTEQEKTFVNDIFTVENIGNLYDPVLSDAVKNQFVNEFFHEHKGEFVKNWLGLVLKYPKDSLESFFANSFGYWHPEVVYWTAFTYTWPENMDMKTESLWPGFHEFIGKYQLQNPRYLPIVSMLYSIGFMFHIVALLFALLLYKRQYRRLVVFSPFLLLWLTCLASPVFAEYRYIYSMFTCIPVLLAFALQSPVRARRRSDGGEEDALPEGDTIQEVGALPDGDAASEGDAGAVASGDDAETALSEGYPAPDALAALDPSSGEDGFPTEPDVSPSASSVSLPVMDSAAAPDSLEENPAAADPSITSDSPNSRQDTSN